MLKEGYGYYVWDVIYLAGGAGSRCGPVDSLPELEKFLLRGRFEAEVWEGRPSATVVWRN